MNGEPDLAISIIDRTGSALRGTMISWHASLRIAAALLNAIGTRETQLNLQLKGTISILAVAAIVVLCAACRTDARWGLVYPATPDSSELEQMALTGLLPGEKFLAGESFVVYSAVESPGTEPTDGPEWDQGRHLAMSDAEGHFLIRPTWGRADGAAEVSAFYHLNRYLKYFRALGFGDFGEALNIAVNYHPEGKGDFLAGSTLVRGRPGMVVGQWGERNLAFDPDVLGHELFHVVQSQIVPESLAEVENAIDSLGFNTVPMAVAEAVADYFSCSLSGDPYVGEYTAAALGLPFLSTLANDTCFPRDRTGQSHRDGQALSGALWEVRGIVGARALDQALYDALVELPGIVRSGRVAGERCPTFALVVDRILTRMQTVVDKTVAGEARRLFAARGLTTDSNIVSLATGEPRRLWIPGIADSYGNVESQKDGLPAPLQLRIDLPAECTAITISLSPDGRDEKDETREAIAFRVDLRADEPVRYTLEGRNLKTQSDWYETTTSGAIEISAKRVDALRGRTLFVSIRGAAEDDVDVKVTVSPR